MKRTSRKDSWKQTNIDYIKMFYGKKIAEYEQYHDDRIVYVNTYNIILEALEELPDEPNSFICCAVQTQINEELEMMDKINKRFENR